MTASVFRIWVVIAIALWLYFGPKTFFDSREYRQVLQDIQLAEENLLLAEQNASRDGLAPSGLQQTRIDHETALEQREALRQKLIIDLAGICIPAAFLLLFWLFDRHAKRRSPP